MHERQHIGVHGRIEVTRGGRFEWTKPAGGCVVHENIEPAKRIADKTEHLFDVFFLTHIRSHAGGTPAECGNLLGNLFGFFSTRHIVNYHIRARFGQPQGPPQRRPAFEQSRRSLSSRQDAPFALRVEPEDSSSQPIRLPTAIFRPDFPTG